MSALPPKADIRSAQAHVPFVPIADMSSLFNQLIGTSKQLTGYLEAKRLCSREIDDEIKFGRLLGSSIVEVRRRRSRSAES
jgi:hypothetical protein